jgi:hypothetical protein
LIVAYTTRSTPLAIGMLWLFIPLSYVVFGPTFALVQNLVPANMRSQSVALRRARVGLTCLEVRSLTCISL